MVQSFADRMLFSKIVQLVVVLIPQKIKDSLRRMAHERNEGFRGQYKATTDTTTTMLGETQWKWLEAELRKPADVRIIASSIQVLPDEHGSEKWGNFPHERTRLFRLIRDTKANGVVLISGDRHLAEIMEIDSARSGNSYPIYEVTSSSLNAPSGNMTKAGTRFAN
jgi:alkaline phosphatase D